MINFLTKLTDWIMKGGNITFNEAVRLYGINEQRDIVSLISFANVIREEFSGNKFNFYVNINMKTGECGNDCGICFNSPRFDIDINEPAKAKKEFINSKAEDAARLGADRFSITICGGIAKIASEADSLVNILKKNLSIETETLPSLGIFSGGMPSEYGKFNFNNDSGNIYSAGSSTGDIEKALYFGERLKFLESARRKGYRVSSGATFSAGETLFERLIPMFVFKELDIDFIALNFVSSGKNKQEFHPMEAVKLISIYRFLHPYKEIILAGRQWKNFKIIRPLILLSGANGVMAGSFFSAASRNVLEDIKSLADFKLIQ